MNRHTLPIVSNEEHKKLREDNTDEYSHLKNSSRTNSNVEN
jgi:hypothetical protein